MKKEKSKVLGCKKNEEEGNNGDLIRYFFVQILHNIIDSFLL